MICDDMRNVCMTCLYEMHTCDMNTDLHRRVFCMFRYLRISARLDTLIVSARYEKQVKANYSYSEVYMWKWLLKYEMIWL